MNKFFLIVISSFLFFTQPIFADTSDMMSASEGKACDKIAQTCISAGYVNKKFWQGCMQPLLYGKTVTGLTISDTTLNACRQDKVNELQQELKAIQSALQKSK